MIENKHREIAVWTAVFAGTVVLGGGYFIWVSAVLSIILGAALFIRIARTKRLLLPCDFFSVTLILFPFFFLLCSLWAVDRGMAPLGFIKFLPVPLFFINIEIADPSVKNGIRKTIPMLACSIVILSYILYSVPLLRNYLYVEGRLGGTFQYPNTFAVFLLAALIIYLQSEEDDPEKKINSKLLRYIEALVIISGIVLTGSRTVYILTVFVFIAVFLKEKSLRKQLLILAALVLASALILTAVCSLTAIGETLIETIKNRLLSFSPYSSTLNGRLLYAGDALPLIGQNPFGLGYYGYFFAQGQIQTGVYSVANAHNELLQIMLDIGIIPALVCIISFVSAVFSKNISFFRRLAIITILLHSLFDYDFQFLSIFFLFILLCPDRKIKEIRITAFSVILSGGVLIGISCISVLAAGSDICFLTGNYRSSVQLWHGNTLAKMHLLSETDYRDIAISILEDNKTCASSWAALARSDLSEGNVPAFIEKEKLVFQLAPYQADEYKVYLYSLYMLANNYLENNDDASALFILNEMEGVSEAMKELKERTSFFGYRIVDKPITDLSAEEKMMIEAIEKDLSKLVEHKRR